MQAQNVIRQIKATHSNNTYFSLFPHVQDTLVDADVAIDAMMWQNGGMCGLDHWNFVMHPVDAAMTCDPYGSYVRKWCPELSDLPDELIHKPWKCPASVLRRAGEEVALS